MLWCRFNALQLSSIKHSNIEPMSNTLKRSELIKERFIYCSRSGELNYTDELHILKYLCEKFKLMTVSEYAKQEGISFNGAKSRLKKGKEMYLQLKGQRFVCG